jgi:DNA-binding NtrC family response regulator
MRIFVDDRRQLDEDEREWYMAANTLEQAETLIQVFRDDLETVSLDYDLGRGTGLDILVYMKKHDIAAKEIIIHSTHKTGIKKMKEYAKENFPHSTLRLCPRGSIAELIQNDCVDSEE